jgi:hypothetical protein
MRDQSKQDFVSCQLINLGRMYESLKIFESIWQFRDRLRRYIKRRFSYASNSIRRKVRRLMQPITSKQTEPVVLQAGDVVRIRSKAEIRSTLGLWNELRGCVFMDEMWNYCGTTQRVLKRAEKFMDERSYKVKKARGLVILEGVICQGTIDFGPCDRSCFFFWREEWLEKI